MRTELLELLDDRYWEQEIFPLQKRREIQTSLAVIMQEDKDLHTSKPWKHAPAILFLIVESDNDVQVLILCTGTKDR